jgi:hypothetical protein
MSNPYPRWRIFVDRPIQGALLCRALMYWMVSLLMQQLIVFLFVLVTSSAADFGLSGARLFWHIEVSIIASLAILPIMLLDILKLSHRWVGPLFRLRASLHDLSLGQPVPPIRFRDGDFWQDLARDVNVVTAELNRLRAKSQEFDPSSDSPLSSNDHGTRCGSQQETEPALPDSLRRFNGHGDGADAPPSIPVATGWSAVPTSAR